MLHRLRQHLTRVGAQVPLPMRDAARPIARRLRLAAPIDRWWRAARPPWDRPTTLEVTAPARCNICRWTGDRFDGEEHAPLPWVTAAADDRQAAQLGFLPPYHFVTWECRRP